MIALDTNVLARFLLGDIPDHAERSAALLRNASVREQELFVSSTVLAELSWLLTKQRAVPRYIVAQTFSDLLDIPGVVIEHSGAVREAIAFWRDHGGVSYVDCYHLALTKELGMTQIYTFDRKMDRFPGVERMEP